MFLKVLRKYTNLLNDSGNFVKRLFYPYLWSRKLRHGVIMFVSLYQSLSKTQKAARKLLREHIISIMIGLPKTYVRYVKGKHFNAILYIIYEKLNI